jgi:hypothetical protein
MPFYVPVGPRGIVFRVGMVLTGAFGAPTYWLASRRRPASPIIRPSSARTPPDDHAIEDLPALQIVDPESFMVPAER